MAHLIRAAEARKDRIKTPRGQQRLELTEIDSQATSLVKQERWNEAEEMFRRSLSLCRDSLSLEHDETMTRSNNFGRRSRPARQVQGGRKRTGPDPGRPERFAARRHTKDA